MKKLQLLAVILLAISIITACSNNNDGLQEVNAGSPQSSPNESKTANETTAGPTEKTDEGSQAGEEEGDNGGQADTAEQATSLLQEAVFNTMAVHSLNFVTSVDENIIYVSHDGSGHVTEYITKSDYTGSMYRDPAGAKVELNVNHLTNDQVANTSEEWTNSFSYYMSKDQGHYSFSSSYDNFWYREDISEDFKTVEHLEDIIDYFLSHPDKLSISDYNGNISIDLTISPEEFADQIQLLTYTFFNGQFEKAEYEHMLDIPSEHLHYNYVSLILDDTTNVAGYFVSYGSRASDGAEDDKYTFFMMVDFSDLNEAEPFVIPENVVQDALETSEIAG